MVQNLEDGPRYSTAQELSLRKVCIILKETPHIYMDKFQFRSCNLAFVSEKSLGLKKFIKSL